MPKTKEEKIQDEKLLTFIITAIYDLDKKMVIKTENDGYETKIPKGLKDIFGQDSAILARVQTIKIGSISMQRVAKTGKKRSCEYIVRTPSREARFTNNDIDFKRVWYVALGRYVAEHNDKKHFGKVMMDIMNALYKFIRNNDDLAVAVDDGETVKITKPKESTKLKYEVAIKHLKEMGIDPKRFAAYIEKQTANSK